MQWHNVNLGAATLAVPPAVQPGNFTVSESTACGDGLEDPLLRGEAPEWKEMLVA